MFHLYIHAAPIRESLRNLHYRKIKSGILFYEQHPHFFERLACKFPGAIALGTMSITSTQIAVQESFRNAWKYSLGVAIVEIIYLRFTLTGVDWIIQHSILFIILGWVTAILFLILGIFSFLTAYKQQAEKSGITRKQYQQVFPWSKHERIESRPNTILVYMEFLFNQ